LQNRKSEAPNHVILHPLPSLRRLLWSHTGQGIYQYGTIRVDVREAQVTREGKPVYLTAREFQLLRYLIERAGTTVARDELLRSVWGYDSDTLTRTVDTHVASLRQKLEQNPKKPELILSVSGVGYRFMGRSS